MKHTILTKACAIAALTVFPFSTPVAHAQEWNTPSAGNPFVPGYFADPTIRKFGDTYYLYATTDGTGNGYGPAQVWVSYDFRNWKNIVMNWPTTEVVWAPDVVQQADGTYRYYYCEPCVVSIGESTSPIGPWKNILGREDAVMVPDRYVHNVITLDPQLFRDDDGQEYLYFTTWGIYKGFGCGVAKLRKNVKVDSGTFALARHWHEDNPFPIAADEFFSEKKLISNDELKDIFEAPFVFKRNGVYYFTYSSGSCHDDTYRVQYATSTVGPMGPFKYKGCILRTNSDQTVHGPGHHSILVEDGRYYIVYHRHNNPRSVHGFNRQVCIDEMLFDADGDILPVVPTHSGTRFFTHHPVSSGSRNLAFGARVTASSYYDNWFRPEYAVDDNNGTLWKAAGSNWGQDKGQLRAEWLQIDLGKKQRFSEVWTQFEYATFFYQYKIETSNDGKAWTLYADRTQNTMQGSPMIDKKTVKARYIRITVTDTQKNGHMPAIWNVKVWQQAPKLPSTSAESNDGYPGMHRKDVTSDDRQACQRAVITIDAHQLGDGRTAPADISEVSTPGGMTFKANKALRLRVKDGRWALFFNGSQHLASSEPLSRLYSYNAPYTISLWALQTEPGAVPTIVSLSSSRADLATTELRLGSDSQSGLINHNGSFESSGAPDAVSQALGAWHHWVVTFDGWMERVYLDGKLLQEKNNFLMIRPEGRVTIGSDASGANHYKGYVSNICMMPYAVQSKDVQSMFSSQQTWPELQPLGDEPFDESDPDSRFTLSPSMQPICQQQHLRLAATTADFNNNPLDHGATIYQEVAGDFVAMATVSDMEGLASHSVKGYNEVGLLIKDKETYYQIGAFPLYNCGNILTILSQQGRPQYPNYKGYDFDPILQFERRGNKLYARTSRDGKKWANMPGSPLNIGSSTLGIGIYQTTYSSDTSWAEIDNFVVYK